MEIAEARKEIVKFIADYIGEFAPAGAVIGLSGGLDSAVTAALSVEALGEEKVDVIALPYSTSDRSSGSDAEKIAKRFGLNLETFDISETVDAAVKALGDMDRVRLGNIAARARMIFLYDIAQKRRRLVVGTGNRTERLLGYTTLWGDMACAIAPLGDLYKTQERKLAVEMGLPRWIIEKTPTADLWQGQTDEGEMGITYESADKILYNLFDVGKAPEDLIAEGFEKTDVDVVIKKYESSHFKRRMPLSPGLTGLRF